MTTKKSLKANRYYKKLTQQNHWVKFPLSWCVRFDMSPLDVVIFAIIDVATKDGTLKTFLGSVENLCTQTNTSKPTVRRSLDRLVESGFVNKDTKTFKDKATGEIKTWVCYTSAIRIDDSRSIEEQCEINLAKREVVKSIPNNYRVQEVEFTRKING